MSFQISAGRTLGAVALSLAVLAAPTPVQAERPEAPSPAVAAPRAASATALPSSLRQVLTRVNAARARQDRKPLRLSACLTGRVAQPWARHLADIEQLVHRNLQRVFKICPKFNRLGENIAYGYPSAAAVMRGWMHSPGHRRNILNRRFTKIGLGVAQTRDGTKYWVQNFGG